MSTRTAAQRDPAPGYLTLVAAADRLGTCTKTIRRRIADGTLRGYRIAGTRGVRVAAADVEAMLRPIPAVSGAA